MNVITVNGKRVEIEGNVSGISIRNGVITVGGKVVADGLQGVVHVEWSGPLAALVCEAPVTVSGNVDGDVTAEGPVNCGNVTGNVKANGPANCGNVGGSVKANGPVIHR